jgi:hypothetical protein
MAGRARPARSAAQEGYTGSRAEGREWERLLGPDRDTSETAGGSCRATAGRARQLATW